MKQQSKAKVRQAIKQRVNSLPASYSREQVQQLNAEIYQHLFENYFGGGQSIYQRAA